MTAPILARARIRDWLDVYSENGGPARSPRLAVSYETTPLLYVDLESLVEAFDKPCGSCHPCENYRDETWRAANRKPPHVYEWDEAVALLAKVRELPATLQAIRDRVHTFPEERTADECIEAVRTAFGVKE